MENENDPIVTIEGDVITVETPQPSLVETYSREDLEEKIARLKRGQRANLDSNDLMQLDINNYQAILNSLD